MFDHKFAFIEPHHKVKLPPKIKEKRINLKLVPLLACIRLSKKEEAPSRILCTTKVNVWYPCIIKCHFCSNFVFSLFKYLNSINISLRTWVCGTARSQRVIRRLLCADRERAIVSPDTIHLENSVNRWLSTSYRLQISQHLLGKLQSVIKEIKYINKVDLTWFWRLTFKYSENSRFFISINKLSTTRTSITIRLI